MADVFYGVDRGEQYVDVVRQGSSPTKDVEIVIDDAVDLTRNEVLIAIDLIKASILAQDDPF